MYNEELQIPTTDRLDKMFNTIQEHQITILKELNRLTINVETLSFEIKELKEEVSKHHDKLLIIDNDKKWTANLSGFIWHNLVKISIGLSAITYILFKIKGFLPNFN